MNASQALEIIKKIENQDLQNELASCYRVTIEKKRIFGMRSSYSYVLMGRSENGYKKIVGGMKLQDVIDSCESYKA